MLRATKLYEMVSDDFGSLLAVSIKSSSAEFSEAIDSVLHAIGTPKCAMNSSRTVTR